MKRIGKNIEDLKKVYNNQKRKVTMMKSWGHQELSHDYGMVKNELENMNGTMGMLKNPMTTTDEDILLDPPDTAACSSLLEQRPSTTKELTISSPANPVQSVDGCEIRTKSITSKEDRNFDSTNNLTGSSWFPTDQSSTNLDHFQIHGGEGYGCGICEYRTGSLSILRLHVETHTGQMPYMCRICKNFKTRKLDDLQAHLTKTCGFKVCDKCDYRVRCSKTLQIHKERDHGRRQMCRECDYRANRVDLIKHMEIHKDKLPHVCEVCCNRFRERSSLKVHLRSHKGDEPLSCGKCDFFTAEPHRLRIHLKTHNLYSEHIHKIC